MSNASCAVAAPRNRFRVSYDNPVLGTKTHWYLTPAKASRLILALANVTTDRPVTITLVGDTDAVEEMTQ